MSGPSLDPTVHRAAAEAALRRAASDLRRLLHELVAALDPFPGFLGIRSVQAVEVLPAGAPVPDRGCVVVCPDGELHELVLRMIPGPLDTGGVDQVEELKELDLPPAEFVAYAYSAIGELTRILDERQRPKGS